MINKRQNISQAMARIALVSMAITCSVLLAACSTHTVVKPANPLQGAGSTVHRSKDFIVLNVDKSDTTASLALRYLGSAGKYWVIEDFNNLKKLTPGQEVVIPLSTSNPTGVYANGYQVVPILCYHRFGMDKSKMSVAPDDFARQMAYLSQHDYRVIRLADLIGFLQGKSALPKRAVVITMDDGYKSTYQQAFATLRQYGFPATIFVYSDYVGAREGLIWKEMQEMVASGLVDIQPHSKSHSNLGFAQPDEDEADYQQRIQVEVNVPLNDIVKNLNIPVHTFAFPYGDTNKEVIAQLKQRTYSMAVTVQPGSNAAFAYPYMLQRSMIFGDQDMDAFIKQLDVFQEADVL